MKLLALDIATTTGVAVGDTAGGYPKAWSVNLGRPLRGHKKAAPHEVRFARLQQLVWSVCKEHEIERVAIEAPIGGPRTSHLLVGLAACARGTALLADCKIEKQDIGSVRAHFLGFNPQKKDFAHLKNEDARTMAIKNLVMARCKALRWDVEDHDSADAAAVWSYSASLHDPKFAYRHTPLFGGQD